MFHAGDCVFSTHGLMGLRVYWAIVTVNNFQENYVVAKDLCSLL